MAIHISYWNRSLNALNVRCAATQKKLCQDVVIPLHQESWDLATIVTLGVPIILTSIYLLVRPLRRRCILFFRDDREPITLYHDGSVYCFIFTQDPWAFFLYFAVSFCQIYLLSIYLRQSNVKIDDTDHLFTFRCPDNKVECEDFDSTSHIGWLFFFVINVSYLGADMVLGLLQLRKGVCIFDLRLFYSGFFLLGLGSLTMVTSFVYNEALSEKDTDLFTNVVILLFINYLDEEVMGVCRIAFPNWLEKVLSQARDYLQRLPRAKKESITEEESVGS